MFLKGDKKIAVIILFTPSGWKLVGLLCDHQNMFLDRLGEADGPLCTLQPGTDARGTMHTVDCRLIYT